MMTEKRAEKRTQTHEGGAGTPIPDMSDELWIVRHWDGFDGEWIDIGDPMPKNAAIKSAGDKNVAAGRSRNAGYQDIDYYKAFPADTKMVFSDGYSQTRGRQG